jgi:ATP-binding cassette subfamily B protein
MKIGMKKEEVSLIIRSLSYIKKYKFSFLITLFCVLMGIVFGIIQPLLLGKVITNLYSNNYQSTINNILTIFILFILQTGISAIQTYLFTYLNENIIYDITCDMYIKMLELPVKAFDEMRVGDFISRMQGDAATISNILTNQLPKALVDVLRVLILGVVVFNISVPLAVIVLITFPGSYIVSVKAGKTLRKENEHLKKSTDSYFSNIEQTVSGIREVKSLGITKNVYDSFRGLLKNIKTKTIRIGSISALSIAISQTVGTISQTSVIAVGGYLVFKKALAFDYFIAFTSYSQQFSESLMSLTRLNTSIQQVLVSLERIFGIMDNLNYSKKLDSGKKVDFVLGNIEFRDVYFEYNPNTPVLKNISFNSTGKKKVAIVGSSGGGKTTIFNLILRFYEPTSGEIFIDGFNINELEKESVIKNISIVRQETFLFNTTIKENLLYANPIATQEEIEYACRLAYIHEFIISLPEAYNTIVEDKGVSLSCGQKQRIAIARALLKKSKIILLDEVTSSLDNESQYYIKKAIDNLSEEHTVIIIAHRLMTVIDADEIIVMEEGEVIGSGSHESLMNCNEKYKSLFEKETNAVKV